MRLQSIGTGAAIALLTASLSAQAADAPLPAFKGIQQAVSYHGWTGFYLGANAGTAQGRADWDLPLISSNPKGWLGGVTAGLNVQTGSWVWGIEADYNWTDVKSSDTCLFIFTCEIRNTYLATFRGRIGYAFDRFMPYFTGGGAYGDVGVSLLPAVFSAGKSQFGWTVGGGIEYAFLGNWSAKVEYLHVNLGSYDTVLIAPLVDNASFREDIVRVGLNYRFSGPLFGGR